MEIYKDLSNQPHKNSKNYLIANYQKLILKKEKL